RDRERPLSQVLERDGPFIGVAPLLAVEPPLSCEDGPRLLEEVGHTLSTTSCLDRRGPFRLHRPRPSAGLATDDDPVNAIEAPIEIERSYQRLAREEADLGRHAA